MPEQRSSIGAAFIDCLVTKEDKLMRKWKLGLAGPESWGSMIGSDAKVLWIMDGLEPALTDVSEVILDGFRQFFSDHLVRSHGPTIPVDGGAR